LSHYHDYRTAQQTDRETARAIESLNWAKLDGERGACGAATSARQFKAM
jgi:hypothetical protein